MTYDVYEQAYNPNDFGMFIAMIMGAGVLGIILIFIGFLLHTRKETLLSAGIGVFLIIGAVIGGVSGTNHFATQSKLETARFNSWVEKNYDLNLTKTESAKLEFSEELLKEHDGQLEKLTLEEYQGGVVIMNDGKAIKQK